VGFPLLVKAAAGGGGIGMRRVDRAGDLSAAVEGVQQMAARAFGSGDVYLERLVARARHVEVQVFGFGDGRAIHLFERDCSLQRRFQKVIEEAPAPDLPDAGRAALCEAALALCRATRYAGAGTVEFVLDAETGGFFFLEMNTRIQVEHPVTEMVTGADIVAMQIAFARDGAAAPALPAAPSGHAVECRLYAEDPARGFRPAPGRLERFALPAPAADLRVETGLREGDAVTPFYDPMIAKIVAHGPDRAAARARAAAALAEVDVAGIATNRDFLRACLAHPGFATAEIDTGFVARHHDRLTGGAAA
jgi:acetyl/propionyl-CoA carboxylase alpha subunit